LTKDDIELKLERLIGREVAIHKTIKHSANWVEQYIGMSGILKQIEIGDEHEDIVVLVDVVLVTGKKEVRSNSNGIWLDARDIVEITKR
jgi:hypothetical protein